jgi:hypothetical protein
MKRYNLFDNNFSHTLKEHGHITSTYCYKPEKTEWVLKQNNFDGVTVFTDHFIRADAVPTIRSINSPYKVAWIIEPKVIHSWPYYYIKRMLNEFDLVLSHHNEVLELSDKCKFVPGNGSWIEEKNWGTHEDEKENLICMIVSEKNDTYGHKMRHAIVKAYEGQDKFDLYGRAYNPIPDGKKEDVLKKYMFSIEIENCLEENYFSEKLIDCLALGTIPIYYGPQGVTNYFNNDAILHFTNPKELKDILDNVSQGKYTSLAYDVRENYEAVKKFRIMDDYVTEVVEKHTNGGIK